MILNSNGKKSLKQLENNLLGTPLKGSTRLVNKVDELYSKNLDKFDVEDLRLMISQNIGLQFLMPRAINILKENLFVEGDFFPGDLLISVLSINIDFWIKNTEMKQELCSLLISNENEFAKVDVDEDTLNDILNTVNDFFNPAP